MSLAPLDVALNAFTLARPEDVLKRPMAKFVQDIVRNIGLTANLTSKKTDD